MQISNKVLRKSEEKSNENNISTKTFEINEFNPNDVDVKFEKDTPIDKLKLFKISTTSTRSAANLFKKANLDHEKEPQLDRLENTYVSNPTELSEQTPSSNLILTELINKYLFRKIFLILTEKLQIYEVNFENNFAYITPSLESKSSSSILMSPPPPPGSCMPEKNQNDDTEIYQSISDLEGEQVKAGDQSELIENEELRMNHANINESITNEQSFFNETVDSTQEIIANSQNNIYNGQSIYNVPTNKRVINESFRDENNSSNMLNQNSSIVRLLNETDNETHA